jgi:hypothetical protein
VVSCRPDGTVLKESTFNTYKQFYEQFLYEVSPGLTPTLLMRLLSVFSRLKQKVKR